MNVRSRLCLILFCLLLGSPFIPLLAEENNLDDLLSLSLKELTQLQVVSASRVPMTIDEVPATVRVITAEEIQSHGYFTLEDALSGLPGFQFRNILGFNSYVFMRGVPSQNNKIVLMVNGIQINELHSGGFYAGGQFNLTNVERIEVVYGPASALYGTNAVSGIINVITRDPERDPGGYISAAVGNFGTGLVDFRYAHNDEERDLSYSISGMYKESEKADLKGREGDYNWTDRMENFEKDLSLDAVVKIKGFRFGLVFQDKDASRATVHRSFDTALSDHGVNWHIRYMNLFADYSHEFDDRFSLFSTLYYRDTTVLDDTLPTIELETEESPGKQYRWYRPNHLAGSESRVTYRPTARLTITAGLVMEQERLSEGFSISESSSADEVPVAPDKPAMMTNRLISLYTQAQYELLYDTDLFLGCRYDNSDYYGEVTTPRLGLVFHRERITAKLLYMEAFRAPKPWDFTDGAGSPGLNPEEMSSFELSGAYSFSDHLRLDISLYRNNLERILTWTEEGAGWRWINSGTLDTDGVEINLEYRSGRIRSYINYTYNNSHDQTGTQIPEIARHSANVAAIYDLSRNIKLGIRGHYLGERVNPQVISTTGDDQIDESFTLHTTLSFLNIRKFDIRLIATNLLDEVYYHPSNRPPERYRQPQRSFVIKVGYAF